MSRVFLKKAEWLDVDLLFKWTNDKEVRANSFRSGEIFYETHTEWYRDCLQNNNTEIYLCYLDAEPIGQVRLKFTSNDAQISYSISKEYRGKGFGKIIIQLIETEVINNRPEIKNLFGSVKIDNIASQRVFESLGYKRCLIAAGTPYYEYIKKLADDTVFEE